ncbi:CUL1 [Cordylochernes scorpioides]|uniref:CUL1 n=1 Tax=Cordylochernes scorpioides TaxID=51811 RepID=A0ABY6K6A5_9ARAC|nr:CUL1 [Cordylochernes scorpioides]
MEQKLKQRICIEFCVKLQISATDTFEMLNKAFLNNAPKRTTVFEWHSRFKAGRISIEDDPRQGRPTFQRTDENVQKITDLIKENPRTTLLELEQDTGISKTTIGRIVTEDLRLKKTPAKFIPRFLTNEQKLCRLATCEDMLEMTRTDPEWKDKIITGDETWVYGYDPETKRQSAEWRGQVLAFIPVSLQKSGLHHQKVLSIYRKLYKETICYTLSYCDMQESERKGEIINSDLISSVCFSLCQIGKNEMNKHTEWKPSLGFYKTEFEEPMLEATRQFYFREIDENKIIFIEEYAKWVEKVMIEEKDRARRYLPPTSWDGVLHVCQTELIINHLDSFMKSFLDFLINFNKESLASLYRFLNQIPNIMDGLYSTFENLVHNQGLEAIAAVEKPGAPDPKLYYTTILKIYEKYKTLVVEEFDNNVGFSNAFERACVKFVNENAITKKFEMVGKSSELLAKYCDILLKNSKGFREFELEEALDNTMNVFKLIKDTDVFQEHYSKLLAERLISESSFSDDAETSMLSRLKSIWGNTSISKLQNLYQDIQNSKVLSRQFMKQYGGNFRFGFNINVIAHVNWPNRVEENSFSPSSEFLSTIQYSSEFYNTLHKGRKLQFLYNVSRGEIVTKCYKKPYTIQASLYQMTILLLFNSCDHMKIQELMNITNLNEDTLIEVINILVKSKLLISEDNTLNRDSIIKPNLEYNNKKLKININVPLKTRVKVDEEKTNKKIEEDRIMVIKSAIVRIMKMRKTLSYQDLTRELFAQLKKWFNPSSGATMKALKSLIHKEYIKEMETKDMFEYVA